MQAVERDEAPAQIGCGTHFASSRAYVVLMIAGQQEYLIPSAAEEQIEMIEDVAAENAQVGCCWIGEGSEVAANASWAAVGAEELQHGVATEAEVSLRSQP